MRTRQLLRKTATSCHASGLSAAPSNGIRLGTCQMHSSLGSRAVSQAASGSGREGICHSLFVGHFLHATTYDGHVMS